MRDDLRQHEHTKPGTGGYIDFAQRANESPTDVQASLTAAASGTETVAASSGAAVSTGITDRTANLTLTTNPDSGFSGSGNNDQWYSDMGLYDSTFNGAALGWNGTDGEWEVWIRNDTGSQIDVDWAVYEL